MAGDQEVQPKFGKVCCEWRDKFKAKGFRKEGDGVSPILDELGIPKSSAYYWMFRYEVSIGAKTANLKNRSLKPLRRGHATTRNERIALTRLAAWTDTKSSPRKCSKQGSANFSGRRPQTKAICGRRKIGQS